MTQQIDANDSERAFSKSVGRSKGSAEFSDLGFLFPHHIFSSYDLEDHMLVGKDTIISVSI